MGSPSWLTGIASRVDELVVEKFLLGWFRGMVTLWRAEHVHQQRQQEEAGRTPQPAPLPMSPRAYSREEKYAVLSAIHDRVFDQVEAHGDERDVERIDPWRSMRVDNERPDAVWPGWSFVVLTKQVEELCDTDRERVEKFLCDIESDLVSLGSERAGADTDRTPITDLCEFVQTMPLVLRCIGFDRHIDDQVRSESCWAIFDRDFVRLRDGVIADYATHPTLALLDERIGATSEAFEKLVKVAGSIRVGPDDGEEHVRWQRALDECRRANAELNQLCSVAADPPAAPAGADPVPTNCFRRRGNMWEIQFEDESGNFGDMKGLQIIYRLLQRPNPHEATTALELMASDADVSPPGVVQPVLDDEAKVEYRQAIADYENEIGQARAAGDDAKVKSLESEKQEVIDVLAAAMGLTGRPRSLGPLSEAKKAKNAVRTNLFRIYRTLETADPAMSKLVAHLRKHIHSEESTFAYRPEDPPDWNF